MAVSPTHKDRATKVTAVSAWQRVAPKRQAMHQFARYCGDKPPPFRMQFHLSPTPRQRRIRRIPTIKLQTMKHIRGNCMRNWVWTQQCGKRGVDATPVRWRRGPTGLRDDAPISDPAPLVWRAPEGPEGTGGLRDAAPSEATSPSLAGGRARQRPEHPWSHKQHTQEGRRAERSSRRGRPAGGPPPTGTHSGRARQRPEHQQRSEGITRPRGGRPRA